MRRRISRVREWREREIGLTVSRKMENLHTNFVQKLNDVGGMARERESRNRGDEIRVLEWRGCLFVCILAWISYVSTFSLFGLSSHASTHLSMDNDL